MEDAYRNSIALAAITLTGCLVASGAAYAQGNEPRDADATAAEDHSVQVYLSEDALQAQYEREIEADDIGPLRARAGVFYNEQRDLIAIGDLLAPVGEDDLGATVQVHVGSRVYGAFLAEEDQDIFGISVGGEAEYFFGGSTSVQFSLYYAPDILTFGAAQNFKDVTLRLRTELRDGTDLFIGYRNFEIDTLVDREVDDNLHVGFKRSF